MPTSLAALLIILLGVFPGVPGEWAYRMLVGTDWREKESRTVIRLLGFSLAGITLYISVAAILSLQQPIYLFPSTYQPQAVSPDSLHLFFLPYAGHIIGATLVGLLVASLQKAFSSRVSPYSSAWDEFVRDCVPRHWVIVSLSNGATYAGMIESSDASVIQTERDIILNEPALYDAETGEYIVTAYQHIFFPASLVSCVGTVSASEDERITKPNDRLFEGSLDHERQSNDDNPAPTH